MRWTSPLYDVNIKVCGCYQICIAGKQAMKRKNPPYLEGLWVSGRGESNPRDLLGRQELYH